MTNDVNLLRKKVGLASEWLVQHAHLSSMVIIDHNYQTYSHQNSTDEDMTFCIYRPCCASFDVFPFFFIVL